MKKVFVVYRVNTKKKNPEKEFECAFSKENDAISFCIRLNKVWNSFGIEYVFAVLCLYE